MKVRSLIAAPLLALTLPTTTLAADPAPTAPAPASDPVPAPAPTDPAPAPALVPAPAPALAPAPATDLAETFDPTPPPDDYNPFEIAVTSELHWLVQSSARVTSAAPTQGSFLVHVGYSPVEMVDVYAGYRALYETTRDDKGYALTTDGDAAVLGARLRYPLLRWLSVAAELEVEALHLAHDLAVGERTGSAGEWTFGVVPKLGLDLNLDLGGWEGLVRIQGGYAFRGPASVDMRLTSDASEVVPVDLGTVDLSGPVFALTFGIRF